MSAEDWADCPCCEKDECVRVDGFTQYDLRKDGTVGLNAGAFCTECGASWEVKLK